MSELLWGCGKPALAEKLEARQCHCGVLPLMPAFQAEDDARKRAMDAAVDERTAGLLPQIEISALLIQRGRKLLRSIRHHLEGLRRLAADDDRNVRLQDARLFRRDFRKRVAKVVHVVEREGRYGGHRGAGRGGGIRRSAEAGLQDANLDPLWSEMPQRYQLSQLEVGQGKQVPANFGIALGHLEHPLP